MKNWNIISLTCCISVVAALFVFSYFLVFNPDELQHILREDSVIENLGFIFLFLSSIALLSSGYISYKEQMPGQKARHRLFIMAGLLFFLAAGEEVSWGQRFFSISTPEMIKEVNQQEELNFHNLNTKFFTRLFRHSISLFVLFSTIAFFAKKERLFGIRLPDVAIIYSVILLSSYYHYGHFNAEYHLPNWLALLAFLIYFSIKKQRNDLILTLANISVIIFIVVMHVNFNQNFKSNNTNEVQEFLFSLICFFYSTYLLLDLKHQDKSAAL